jgi:hypothetical protein
VCFRFPFFSANVSGTNHYHTLHYDRLLERLLRSSGSRCLVCPFASSVVAFRRRYQRWGSADIQLLPPRRTGISKMVGSALSKSRRELDTIVQRGKQVPNTFTAATAAIHQPPSTTLPQYQHQVPPQYPLALPA